MTSPKAAGNSALAAMMVTIWPVGTVLPARSASVCSHPHARVFPSRVSRPSYMSVRAGSCAFAASFDSSEEYGESRAVSACGRRSAALMTTVASIMMAANPSSATIHAPYSLHIEIDGPATPAGSDTCAGGPPCRLIVSVRELEWGSATSTAHSPASRVCASLAAIGSSAETFATGT